MAGEVKGGEVGAASKRSVLWAQGLVCGVLLTFAAPTVLVVGVLLAPAIACAAAERGPGGGATRGVAMAGAAASLGAVWRLWQGGDRMDEAWALLCDPATLVLAWGAGACAWAGCQVLPVLLRTGWDLREAARGRAIEAELARCRAEWDVPEGGEAK
jgi:hypothetical protein